MVRCVSPEFADDAQATTILGAILGRYNEIAQSLAKIPPEIDPILWETKDGLVGLRPCRPASVPDQSFGLNRLPNGRHAEFRSPRAFLGPFRREAKLANSYQGMSREYPTTSAETMTASLRCEARG